MGHKSALRIDAEGPRALSVTSGGVYVSADVHVSGAIVSDTLHIPHRGWYLLATLKDAPTRVHLSIRDVHTKSSISCEIGTHHLSYWQTEPPLICDIQRYGNLIYACFTRDTDIFCTTDAAAEEGTFSGVIVIAQNPMQPASPGTWVPEMTGTEVLSVASKSQFTHISAKHASIDNLTSRQLCLNMIDVQKPDSATSSQVVLYPIAGEAGYAMGVETDHMWFHSETGRPETGFKWYSGDTMNAAMTLNGTEGLTIRRQTTEKSPMITDLKNLIKAQLDKPELNIGECIELLLESCHALLDLSSK